jgi:predicted permease
MLANFLQDLRYAARQIGRAPGFTATVVLTLGLGIGANAAIFTFFEQILVRTLPVHEPERLVNLAAPGPLQGSTSCNDAGSCDMIFSHPLFRDLEEAQQPLSGLAAHRFFGANVSTGEETRSGTGVLVSGSYFSVLGLQPALGRLLGPEDDRTPGAHPVAVLSFRFWDGRLGADPGVLNRTIYVNGHAVTVVGVAPRGFNGTTLGTLPDVFVPLRMAGDFALDIGGGALDDRLSHWLYLFGRLRTGVSPAEAQSALNAVFRPILQEVEAPLQSGMSEPTLERFRAREIVLESGQRGQSAIHGDSRVPILLLLGITGTVLLIACANIANLLLARGAGRQQEMLLRGSLGAGRGRLVRQLLTEASLLAVLGGVAGLLFAHWTLRFIGSLLPSAAEESIALTLNPTVALFAAAVALVTGIAFGLFPALHATRTDLAGGLRASGRQMSGARAATRFRHGLVTAQIALSTTLLICAGLFVQSLRNVGNIDIGFRTANLVAFDVNPGRSGYDAERTRTLLARLEEEVAAIPGVLAVSSGVVPVLRGEDWTNNVSVQGFEQAPDVDANASTSQVGTSYFWTLEIPLLAGREFTEADNRDAPRVAVVNQAFARKFGLDEREVVGARMAVGRSDDLDIEIVGLVRDASYASVTAQLPAQFFTPWRQASRLRGLTLYARSQTDPAAVMTAIPAVVGRIDPYLPVENLTSMPRQVRDNTMQQRMIGTLSAAFAALATLLAALGLYGVMAHTVALRTREIGVRIALGAGVARVRGMILRQMGWLALAGGVCGVAGALALGRAAESLLFGVAGHEPRVIAAGVLLVTLVVFSAGYLPTRRATRVDPMVALRSE